MRRPIGLFLLLILVQPLFSVEWGWASSFNVSPLNIVLSGKTTSALVEIKNQSVEPLRLQLSVSTWDQSPTGEMVLGGTDDIIVFPVLLTLEAGETRKIRLGAATPRGEKEKSYRLFVEELPAQQGGPATGGQVRVLTRLSIPVFLQSAKTVTAGEVSDVGLQNGTVSFQIRNTGNQHFSAQQIHVTGKSKSGQIIAKRELTGWYVLAGGVRRYDISLSGEECRELHALTVEVKTETGLLQGQIEVASNACER